MSAVTARFQDKRELILDAAARIFNRHGIKGSMLSQVADEVGLASNSLTYYYRKKEDLACACLLRAMDVMGAAAQEAAKAKTLTERVHGFFTGYFAVAAKIAQGQHPELVVFSDILSLSPPHDATMGAAYTQLFRKVRGLLDASDGPVLSSAARNARAHLILSTISWTRGWIERFEIDDYARVCGHVADLLLEGLAAPGHVPEPAVLELPWAELDGEASDPAARRTAYLRSATRLVNEHGYHGASVDRIAAELQLTKGSFYHHHETKEELISACFERTFAVMRAAQEAAGQSPGTGLDRIAAGCRALLDYQMSHHGPMLRVTAWTSLPDALRSDTRRTMGRLGERFGAMVLDGMRDGSLRIVDPSITAQVVNGMLNAAAEVERWVPGLNAGNAYELYALPLFTGLQRRE